MVLVRRPDTLRSEMQIHRRADLDHAHIRLRHTGSARTRQRARICVGSSSQQYSYNKRRTRRTTHKGRSPPPPTHERSGRERGRRRRRRRRKQQQRRAKDASTNTTEKKHVILVAIARRRSLGTNDSGNRCAERSGRGTESADVEHKAINETELDEMGDKQNVEIVHEGACGCRFRCLCACCVEVEERWGTGGCEVLE